VFRNSRLNGERAINERVFYIKGRAGPIPPPRPWKSVREVQDDAPLASIFKLRLQVVRSQLISHVREANPTLRKLTDEEFVLSRAPEKRKLALQAVVALNGCEPCFNDSIISAFVKDEKTENIMKDDPVPRLIQPRTMKYNVGLGKYTVPLEHPIYDAIDRMFGGRTVMKGLNAKLQGAAIAQAWNEFNDPVAISVDAARFDQHTRQEALMYEHSLYTPFFSGEEGKQLKKLLKMQLTTKGYLHTHDGFTFKYKTDGGRCSGDMNTALGNIIIMCSLMRLFFYEQRIGKHRLINNGDDSVLIVERRDLQRVVDNLRRWFIDFGYTMEVDEVVDRLERVKFCQTQPVCIDSEWVMQRDPYVHTGKDAICLAPVKTIEDLKAWASSVSSCGMSLCGGVPISQAYYCAMGRFGGGREVDLNIKGLRGSGFVRLAAGMERKFSKISDGTRESYFWAFGVIPEVQIEIEQQYDALVFTDVIRGLSDQVHKHDVLFPNPLLYQIY